MGVRQQAPTRGQANQGAARKPFRPGVVTTYAKGLVPPSTMQTIDTRHEDMIVRACPGWRCGGVAPTRAASPCCGCAAACPAVECPARPDLSPVAACVRRPPTPKRQPARGTACLWGGGPRCVRFARAQCTHAAYPVAVPLRVWLVGRSSPAAWVRWPVPCVTAVADVPPVFRPPPPSGHWAAGPAPAPGRRTSPLHPLLWPARCRGLLAQRVPAVSYPRTNGAAAALSPSPSPPPPPTHPPIPLPPHHVTTPARRTAGLLQQASGHCLQRPEGQGV